MLRRDQLVPQCFILSTLVASILLLVSLSDMVFKPSYFTSLISHDSCPNLLVLARACASVVSRNQPLLINHVDLALAVGVGQQLVRHHAHLIGLL